MQEFEETQVWPLTSPTTCYTGAVAVDASDGAAKWATERHSCQVHSLIGDDNNNIHNNTKPIFSWNSLIVPESNRKDESTIAVGYSVCRDWEAVALLDLSNLPADSTTTATTASAAGQAEDPHESTPAPLIRRDSENSVKTAASNAATLNTSSGQTQSQHQSQSQQSQSQQSQAQQQQTPQRGMHRQQLSMDSLSMAAITEQSETHPQPQQPNQQPQPHQAQLILRQRTNDTATSTGDTAATTTPTLSTTTEYAVKLDFRPMAPLVCQFPVANASSSNSNIIDGDNDADNNSTSDDSMVTGVFLGSADNHRLHWFVPSDTNAALESIDLQDVVGRSDSDNEDQAVAQAFVFESSIMALAFCAGYAPTITDDIGNDNDNSGNDHCLVVACQDGAIRLITFWYAQGIFTRVQHTTIVVDGPLVCLHVRYLPPLTDNANSRTGGSERGRRHVVVGSLCGYVAELYETASSDGLSSSVSLWDGPYMVAEGLWSQKLKSEDSVLAVHAYNDNVVLGTLSGRCLLYQKFGDTYELVWECRLPYSIHAVCHVPVGASADPDSTTSVHSPAPLPPSLLVTTRRSVHLLTPKQPRYSASLAKERLEKLLQQYTPAPVQDEEQEQDLEQEHDLEQEQEPEDAKDPTEDNDDTTKREEIPVPANTTSTPTSDDIVTAIDTDVAPTIAIDTATEELPSLSSSSPPPPVSDLVDQSSPQTKVE